MFSFTKKPAKNIPWNKGKLVGQKPPLKLREIWSIRIRLQLANKIKELALFDLAIDSKLRSCDLVKLKIRDILQGSKISKRAKIIQQKTQQPVQFEITKPTREAIRNLIEHENLRYDDYLFKSRRKKGGHISTRNYAHILESWISSIDLNPSDYGTHSLRRTKATLIYRQTKNIRAVQILLGHTKLESTVQYLGIEIEDALELSEQIEV